jgi:hypothetical protein
MVFVPCSRKHGKHCSPAHAAKVAAYRDERRRQELVFEGMTGGYAGDAEHAVAQGNTLVTFGDWLKATKERK